MNYKKIITVSLIVVIAAAAGIGAWFGLKYFTSRAAVEPDKTAILSIDPATGTYNQGDEFSLNLKVDTGNQEIGSIKSQISYDPDVLTVLETSKNGSILNTFMAEIGEKDGKETGKIHLLGSTNKTGQGSEEKITYKTTPGDEPGQVMRIDFKAKDVANTETEVGFVAGESGVYLAEEIEDVVYNILKETRGGSYIIGEGGGGEVPTAPKNLTAIAGDQKVDLNWTASESATDYLLSYGTKSGSYELEEDKSIGNVTNYEVASLTNGTTYYFIVKAKNDIGVSDPSNEASATPTTEEEKLFSDIAHEENNNAVYGSDGKVDRYDFIFLMSTWYFTKADIEAAGYTDPNVDYAKDQGDDVVPGQDDLVSKPEFIWMMSEWLQEIELGGVKNAQSEGYTPDEHFYSDYFAN